jgi:hypothetical protein
MDDSLFCAVGVEFVSCLSSLLKSLCLDGLLVCVASVLRAGISVVCIVVVRFFLLVICLTVFVRVVVRGLRYFSDVDIMPPPAPGLCHRGWRRFR